MKHEYFGIDLTFEGVGKSNEERKEYLYPYPIFNIFDALSHSAMIERIDIVDTAILKCKSWYNEE